MNDIERSLAETWDAFETYASVFGAAVSSQFTIFPIAFNSAEKNGKRSPQTLGRGL
jgi:hypothetical protein